MQKLTIGQIAENRLSRVFSHKPDIIPISKAKEPSVRRGQKLGRKGQKTLKREIMEDQRQHCLLGLRSHSSCGCLLKNHPRSSQSPF